MQYEPGLLVAEVIRLFDHEDGAMLLDPDVRQYFPDSEAVNAALRCLIPLLERRAACRKYGEGHLVVMPRSTANAGI